MRYRHRMRLGLVVLLVACSKSPPVAGPGPDLDNMRLYEPLAMRDDAKLPDKAVILGTDAKGNSTVLKIPAAPAAATVDAPAADKLVSVKLTTAPNADGNVHVGIFEERSGGSGTQWRASVWVAAIVAAHTLGKDLTDFTFGASAADSPDGPSASGLIAGGFLATMTGAAVDARVTAIGVINPDGTIGPAGGLPDKVRAAIASGKKTIGYPAGMRRVGAVDVVELAKTGGATAVEVGNVHDIYKLLTGKALPATLPVTVEAMAIEADRGAAIDRKYADWQSKLAARATALAELQRPTTPRALLDTAAAAKKHADRAAALRAKGASGPAYANIVAAWGYASAATDSFAILTKVRAGDLAGALSTIDNLAALEASGALDAIASARPNTIGGHLLMMGAYQSALRGSGFASMARWRVDLAKPYIAGLDGKSKTELESAAIADELISYVLPAELLVAHSALDSAIAVQRLEFESGKSINYMCNVPNVIKLANSYRSAASAGMTYLESVLVEPLAKSASITADEARLRVGITEPTYLVAFALAHLDQIAANVKTELGENSLAWNLLQLAGAERSYADAAQLTAKYYSFAEGNRHDGALASLLDNAERAARSSARAAEIATGAIPVQAKIAYQHATAQRAGDRVDQQDALASYWAATAYSQAAVMMARN